jgi:hypothetical protein
MIARSRGWPFRVVAAMTGGGFLNFGTWNLLFCVVAVKLRVVIRGQDFCKVVAVRVKLQKGRIHLIFIQLRSESLNRRSLG